MTNLIVTFVKFVNYDNMLTKCCHMYWPSLLSPLEKATTCTSNLEPSGRYKRRGSRRRRTRRGGGTYSRPARCTLGSARSRPAFLRTRCVRTRYYYPMANLRASSRLSRNQCYEPMPYVSESFFRSVRCQSFCNLPNSKLLNFG